jgi:hypothetical protein
MKEKKGKEKKRKESKKNGKRPKERERKKDRIKGIRKGNNRGRIMRTTFRASVFETNSSSSHTFIHITKETFEDWKKRDAFLIGRVWDDRHISAGSFYKTSYDERHFATIKEIQELRKERWKVSKTSYEELLDYYSLLGGDLVLRRDANKRYISEDYGEGDDDDGVIQEPYMEVIDNGKTVTIHIWGRLD